MSKIEKSLSVLNKLSFLAQTLDKGKAATIGYVVPLELAIENIKSISKTDWNFPEQNHIPENNKKVLCYDSKNNAQIGFHKEFDKPNQFIDNHGHYFYCIAWAELPLFL